MLMAIRSLSIRIIPLRSIRDTQRYVTAASNWRAEPPVPVQPLRQTRGTRHVESNQTVNVASDSFGAPSGGSIKLDDTLNTDDATALNTGSVWPTDGTSCSDYIASHPELNGMLAPSPFVGEGVEAHPAGTAGV